MGATLLSVSVFAEDPSTFMAYYDSTVSAMNSDLQQAREALVSLNETDSLARLDTTGAEISQLQQTIDTFMVSARDLPRDTRLSITLQYVPQMWPGVQAMTEDLERLAGDQQAKLAAERTAGIAPPTWPSPRSSHSACLRSLWRQAHWYW